MTKEKRVRISFDWQYCRRFEHGAAVSPPFAGGRT
jgi:hypothetical protein